MDGQAPRRKGVYIRTFGCQMNEHDSERMAGLLERMGYSLSRTPTGADIIIVNSCSIREKAEQKAFSELGFLARLKRENPHLIIGFAGCVAQQEGEEVFRRNPLVDLVFGSSQIPLLPSLIEQIKNERRQVDSTQDPVGVPIGVPAVRADTLKAWVTISEGCNHQCSFCVVPMTRGPQRDRRPEDILQEVCALGEQGYKEVTLLGQNVNSYGKNSGCDFPDLLRLINDVPGIERIRFTTSHPADLSPRLIRAMRDLPHVCEHLHLPLQSGSDKVLDRMRRGYTYREYARRVGELRAAVPRISLTTDLIVGFPGEEEEDYKRTLSAVEEIQFDGAFAFKYSARPHTAALDLDGHLPEEVKAERLERVLSLQREITLRKNEGYVGRVEEVLVEGKSKTNPDKLTGRTRTNRVVNFIGSSSEAGKLIEVKITAARVTSLEGESVGKESLF